MVRKISFSLGVCLSLGIIISLFTSSKHFFHAESDLRGQESSARKIHYDIYLQSNHRIHAITIPHNSNYFLTPAIKTDLTNIDDFAQEYQALVAINGGYFDPQNQKTTSYVTQQGNLLGDPRTNERLIENPSLQPYIEKILNRIEFRSYLCGQEIIHDIVLHSTPIPEHCQLEHSLGGGPGLLPTDTSVEEGFIAYQDGAIIRDAIGHNKPNARSAIAITKSRDVILIMVEQKSDSPLDSGISLPDLANFLSTLDVEKAMNLDGGSSAALYVRGRTIYGKVDKLGNKVERSIKSVLLVTKN